jgi:hypothetical protein
VDKVSRIIEHEFRAEPDKATFKQCKHIWSLCIIAGIDPVWCKGIPYANAVALITQLERIRWAKHGHD